jgi:autotransporter-associated beta strand protein
VWDGSTPDFNTSPEGGGTNTATTSTNTQVVFAGGTNPPSTVVVSGSQGASGLVIESGAFTFDGTNSATITVGSEGIANKATVTGTTTFVSSVGLIVGASQSWSNAAATGLTAEGQVTGNGSLTLSAASSGGIVLSGPVDHAGAITNSGAGSGTTTISGVIGTNVSGVTQDSMTSTLVLSGTNAYTGPTTVAAGHLVVDGDISASALTSVQGGGTLSGAGRVGDTVILAGGTLSPGNSPRTLNITGDIDWLGGGNYNWQIVDAAGTAGLAWDLISVSGALDLSALTDSNEFKINLWSLSGVDPDVNGNASNFDPSRNYTWTIVRALGGINGYIGADQFLVNIGPANGAGGFANTLSDGNFSVLQSGNDLNLVFTSSTPIPEPGTWVAAALLAAAAFARRRKQARGLRRQARGS